MGCPFCNFDESLSDVERQRTFKETQKQAVHIVAHLTAGTSKMQTCPQCQTLLHAAEMPAHLEGHGYNLSGRKTVQVGSNLGNIKDADKGPRKRWREWIDAGCPEDDEGLKLHCNAGAGRSNTAKRKLANPQAVEPKM